MRSSHGRLIISIPQNGCCLRRTAVSVSERITSVTAWSRARASAWEYPIRGPVIPSGLLPGASSRIRNRVINSPCEKNPLSTSDWTVSRVTCSTAGLGRSNAAVHRPTFAVSPRKDPGRNSDDKLFRLNIPRNKGTGSDNGLGSNSYSRENNGPGSYIRSRSYSCRLSNVWFLTGQIATRVKYSQQKL